MFVRYPHTTVSLGVATEWQTIHANPEVAIARRFKTP
jgi:hypothetical protein